MKRILLGLSLIVLLAGCASRENDNGMGGTSDQYNKTDQYNTGNSSDQYNNNATHGTGTGTATNDVNQSGTSQ